MREPRAWVLVSGASVDLKDEEIGAAEEIGRMLAAEGYGLITGQWPGVDHAVTRGFLQTLEDPADEAWRVLQIKNRPAHILWHQPHKVSAHLEDDGFDESYSEAAVRRADAGVIVSGRKGSKPAMDRLLALKKPVLPIAHLGYDAFELFIEVLRRWSARPVAGLTVAQYLELARPWEVDPRTVSRLLVAALAKEPRIFVSYRRSDVPAVAGRLYHDLAHAFGERSVFLDYESLPAGEVLDAILGRLRRSAAVLALIGPGWEAPRSEAQGGGRRIDDPEDFVRRELILAEAEGIPVLPLVVRREGLPADLPEPLGYLKERNWLRFDLERWPAEMEKVIGRVEAWLRERG